MKKVVKSKAALNAKALQNGGTVTNKSGQKFNAKGKKKQIVKRYPPKKKQVAQKTDASKLVADAVDKQTYELKLLLEGLKEQIALASPNQAPPITEWDFNVTRDSNKDILINAEVPDVFKSKYDGSVTEWDFHVTSDDNGDMFIKARAPSRVLN